MKTAAPSAPKASPAARLLRPANPLALVLMFFAGLALLALLLAALSLLMRNVGWAQPPVSDLRLEQIPFDGQRAYGYLKQLCEIGPRPSGSPGMLKQQKLLEEHFTKLGAQVEYQRFTAPDPRDGSAVPMANMVIRWNADNGAKERILLAAHYDTLPLPLRDRRNPRGRFIGANDNASGVAVLMELGNEMAKLKSSYGIDFVLLDSEEYIFSDDGEYFLGSTYFSRQYQQHPPPYRYRWGVLLDMIGDRDLQVYQEGFSVGRRATRPLVQSIWATAARLGVKEFIPRVKQEIRDDHLVLSEIGKIPTCDLIDMDYPAWHTEADTPQQCSALSLAKVGWVVRTWLETVP